MESFHFTEFDNQSRQKSYDFSSENLADIPCPDDNSTQEMNSSPEDVELPLPPGTSGDDFPIPLPPRNESLSVFNNFCPSLPLNKAFNDSSNLNHVLEPENFNILPLHENDQQNLQSKSCMFLDSSKYSPSKVDSDEENQDFITTKPKVLGKEQAKKRLMAFSLSKQSNIAVKKQNKAFVLAKNKEKPPHPNKSSNVQDQFRATISAIEEEKKKMFQNMPSYLLMEMSELAKSLHSNMSSSTQLLEKLKNESLEIKKNENSGKDGGSFSEGLKSKRNFVESRSRSNSRNKSKKQRRSRSKRKSRSRSRSGSKSRSRRSNSRSRRRSRSKNRRSTSRSRRTKDDKIKKEKESALKKKSFKDWNDFRASGLSFDKELESVTNRIDEPKPRRDDSWRKSNSPNDPLDFKPVFDYLNISGSQMKFLKAKPSDSSSTSSVLFPERIVKYTLTKPVLCWAENPNHATDYYLSKQMLLENCDPTTSCILNFIIKNKRVLPEEIKEESTGKQSTKARLWYPREDYLMPSVFNTEDDLKSNKMHCTSDTVFEDIQVKAFENVNETDREENISKGQSLLDKKVSLVNDSYLSEEEEDPVKEMVVGDLKVHLDVDLKSVKVRSKWDSDNDVECSERESISQKKKNSEKSSTTNQENSTEKEKLIDDFDVAPCEPKVSDYSENKNIEDSVLIPPNELPSVNSAGSTAGNLVSEYEEFLKMVSVDSIDDSSIQKKKTPVKPKCKSDKSKSKKLEISSNVDQKIQSPKSKSSSWNEESDLGLKSNIKKMVFAGSLDEFLLPGKDDPVMFDEKKNKSSKKKIQKLKSKTRKLLKKASKRKKSKCDSSLSENSTSGSCDSDSDSDSEESDSPKKSKKKKKGSKAKKKSKNDSSGSSSDSDDSKTKKSKSKKKKNGKIKKSNSDDSDESVLLKQLDFKKQLIMKRIEEIDSISDRSTKKKEREIREKKTEAENLGDMYSEIYISSSKRAKVEDKVDKKKSKTSSKNEKCSEKNKKRKKSESHSESSDEESKRIKNKKVEKRKRDYSESSESEEKTKHKSKSSKKSSKKTKKSKKSSSSSDYDSEGSSKSKKKRKKKRSKSKTVDEKLNNFANLSFKENLISDSGNKNEEQSIWENKTFWEKPEKVKKKKADDDWETNSSEEELEESKIKESSWNDRVEEAVRGTKIHASEDSLSKDVFKNSAIPPKNNLSENNSAINQLGSGTLKTSLSNFSFNENSFCSFGQELSRDFFLAEPSCSNSGSENVRSTLIEPRPFQSVSKDSDMKKPRDSELYSPGYSDSELSDVEVFTSEKGNSNAVAKNVMKDDVYDPLDCDSDDSAENKVIELSNIPLPHGLDTLPPEELRNSENVTSSYESSALKDFPQNEVEQVVNKKPSATSPCKYSFTPSEFTPVIAPKSPTIEEKNTPTKRQLMSVKGQQKLISKAASVFQDESDEENFEPSNKKITSENIQSEDSVTKKEKILVDSENIEKYINSEQKDEFKKRKRENRSKSKERNTGKEKEERRRSRSRSRSREKKSSSKISKKDSKTSSKTRKKSRTPEFKREKREIRSDSFEIEPLKSIDSNEFNSSVHPIPVLTGLEPTLSENVWSRSLVPGSEFRRTTDNIIDNAESFDIYPSEESNFRNRSYDKDFLYHDRLSVEKSKDGKSKRERRRTRSKSSSPKRKHKSKSPERRRSPRSRSPRRKSPSPRRWDRSSFSPRRSPKRKSSPRRYKISRSPDKKRKSSSRSPRRRRSSPLRRSRSVSPRKYRSPKHRDESPRKKDSASSKVFSPNDRFSPAVDSQSSQSYTSGLQNRIPVIGTLSEDVDMELSPAMRSNRMDFPPDPSVAESEMYHSFYEGEYSEEYGMSGYSEEIGVNNLITVKNHDIEKANSPERLSLDQRIELELNVARSGPQTQTDQYQMPNPVCTPFQEINSSNFQNSYNCESTNIISDNFYQSSSVQINADFNGQYFNGHQQPQPPPQNYGSFQQYPNSQPAQNSVLQVGNIVEVVPSLQHPPPPPPSLPTKAPQIMQVGNVLQVVPSQKVTPPVPSPVPHNYGLPDASPVMKAQKATAVVAPSSIVPTPNPEVVLNPLIKAIQLEREKRRKEKEKRKAEREARRKARQLRREAKLMSVNEKLKKSVENEGLMLGQEVEDDELLDGLDVPSPPIPVEIITVSSPSALPPAGKGILITAGFMPKPPSEKKEVKFADGVCPGEGTSTSGEDVASPPPKPKLPKEKRFKKKKTKVKKKVKVQIIKQIIQEEDDDEDDLSPPPPPPGDPPPVFFARFPYAGGAQFPVYQTQTTTTTLTTVQYPAETYE